MLDAIGALIGVERKAAMKSKILAQVKGKAQTIIPAGSIAKTINGDVFLAETAIEIGIIGTSQGWFIAQEYGQKPVQANTLTEIVSVVDGWDEIDNDAEGIVGSEAESSADFRKRIDETRYTGVATLGSIKKALQEVAGIVSFKAVENYTDTLITIQGVAVLAHSIYVVAEGATDQDIALAIFMNKSAGCNYSGNIEVAVPFWDRRYTVLINRPEAINIYVSIKLKYNDGQTAEPENIKQETIKYIKGLGIGGSLSVFELSAYLNTKFDIYISDLKCGTTAGSLNYSTIVANLNNNFDINTSNIVIVIEN
jgi:uncharacterized phage protein gp47/JayE